MRHCANPECRKEINECNGFIVGRDFFAFLEGKISRDQVRELCGKCIFKFVHLAQDAKVFEKFLANTASC